MFEKLFGIHEKALLLYGERVGVLANNLANADTPGFKARDIDFRAVLSREQTASQLAVTEPGQVTIGGADPGVAQLEYRNPYQASLDGNTVEMPIEQAAFAENNVRYQASLGFINDEISDLQFAISGR